LNALIQKDLLQNVVDNREYNKVISEYYDRFKCEAGMVFSRPDVEKWKKRLDLCNKYWLMDKYETQKIKDFQKTNLCLDKFCNNCKKVKQASRMAKYVPEIEPYRENLYHLTLTLPNCSGVSLRYTYDKMARAFKSLIRYLSGVKEIKGLDFSSWGYKGSVRSLEVTFKGDSYHPHFHVALVLTGQNFLGEYENVNTYSYNYKNGAAELKRLFCDQEILIQKIWYLLLNGHKVTKDSIDSLELGYSCTLWQFLDDDYAELFKYMTKGTDEKGYTLTYENFISLLHGLYRVKQIQGYGCLYRISDDEITEEYAKIYELMINEIRAKEKPIAVLEELEGLLSDNEYQLISRKSYYKYLKTIE
jgi:plasmid rolling circle replication initiator protein Rep